METPVAGEGGQPSDLAARPDPSERARWPRPAVLHAMVLAFFLHTGAVLWIWISWESGLRGGWLVWMDFPVSLLFLQARDALFLWLSLGIGGLWWAGIGGGLSWLIGRVARGR